MTIKQLITELMKHPLNSKVILSSDAEGNNYAEVDMLSTIELDKSNGNGTFDAVVIYPSDETVDPA